MSDIMKGNFKTKHDVKTTSNDSKKSLEERFEKEALKKLGGSIAFVSKRKVMWDMNEEKDDK